MNEDSFERERLHFAAADGDMARVLALIAEGAPLDAFDDLGRTALHYAAERGHLDIMRALVDAGADVNAHDESRIGDTPLRSVAGNCSYAVAKLLVDAGADPSIPGWMQLTALDASRDRKKPEGKRVHDLLERAAKTPRPR